MKHMEGMTEIRNHSNNRNNNGNNNRWGEKTSPPLHRKVWTVDRFLYAAVLTRGPRALLIIKWVLA